MNDYRSIVSALWLKENLDNPELKIIDCRFRLSQPNWGREEYLQKHIPGAFYFDLNRDLSGIVQKHGGRHPLPEAEVIGQKLADIGVNWGKTEIVAYDDARFAFASRLWWLLRYYGHQQVALLDGGWNNWLELDYPTTDSEPAYPSVRGSFCPHVNDSWVVDRETVKERKDLANVILVDARSGDRFRGETEPIDPVAGCIPGAVNVFWQEITDSDGKMKPRQEQVKLWQPYQDAGEIIVYCGSGVTACVNLLSLEVAGIEGAKLYPGGWSDWCSY